MSEGALTPKTAWKKRRDYLKRTGRWQPFTDATPAREHIEALRRMGMSLDTITDIAGMSIESVNALVYPNLVDYRHEIRHETEARILAVRFDLDLIPEQRWVSNAGSQRRLRALAWMGWGWSDIATRMGVTMECVSKLALKPQNRITARNARIIRDLYDELAMTPGPNKRARTWAVKREWHGPLAWDDDTIDDPAAKPARTTPAEAASRILDEVAVRRAINGDRVHLTGAERYEAVRVLHEQGLSDPAVAERLGLNPGSVFNIRRRNKTPEQVAS